MILAIDTATEQASIALTRDRAIVAEYSWTAGHNHSRHLSAAVREVMGREGITVSNLSAIAVARGPGSFNGLRVGISFAKGMAAALCIPLVGIATLDIIALQYQERGGAVWALMTAGRGELYLGQYAGTGADWRRTHEYERATLGSILERYEGDILLAGPAASNVRDALEARGVDAAVALLSSIRRAGYLAELGMRCIETEGRDEIDTLEPLYMRRSAAEEKRDVGSQE